MENDNEKHAKKARDYFESLAEVNIERLAVLTEIINTELQHTPMEGFAWSMEFALPETSISPRVAQNLIRQAGLRFGFWDSSDRYDQLHGHGTGNRHPKNKDELVRLILDDPNSFLYFRQELKRFIENKNKAPETKYDEKRKKIIFKNKECPIPPGSLEDEICMAIYGLEKKVNEPIEWYQIADRIEGEIVPRQELGQTLRPKDSERYYYAAKRINKKTKKYLGIQELFIFKKLHFIRTQ